MTDTTTAPEPAPDAGETPASPYAWYVLGVLVLVYVLNFVDRQIITILAPDIKRDLGLNDADIGFLYGTAFAVFYALFGIPLGRLADSWSRIRLLTIGLGLWSAMTAASGFARSGVTLGVARMGVGIGEATASPSAYSLISDLFPKGKRGTALAIYSSGLYVGGGVSLMIGGGVVQAWNNAYPGGGPLGLAGWQAAFLAVGLPGLLLALWVSTLREPIRGLIDGLRTPPAEHPFRDFGTELFAVIPPFTLVTAARRGMSALAVNLLAGGLLTAAAVGLILLTGGSLDRFAGSTLQWTCIAFGYYAIFSWVTSLRVRDRPTFALIWGSPAFLCTILGYGCVSFLSYASTAFAPVFAQDVLGASAVVTGAWVGGFGALGGFLGVIMGGRMSDALLRRNGGGRILVVVFGLIAPTLPIWLAFSTVSAPGDNDFIHFVILASLANMLASSALGAAAATTQDLVLPRMRGAATATFFLATTLVGLALGPYLAGYVSATTGSLATGVKSVLLIVPIGLALLAAAYRLVPLAARSVVERARAAGEPI
ncbi:MAG: major Facilitator Superfamily protein [Sphingomonas bacterium]|uniref:MFS transporter n=1 Tax=Sphingomonas bacterium TaxID=1895847 RepID=UPI0026224453|nr:MFS transporter [Sphingomonas bacterium]MDB5696645.1 major Facilitator Superfamily protein [Sphingomonas bacterium]